ncbi:aftiphilin-like isoform X1 [Ornithodoros turicata]|uniref:aftiphilin-like isoform X1 n=1 Tax=Ornithodoros turicata TaxID=34597 RepID=UPI003139AC35
MSARPLTPDPPSTQDDYDDDFGDFEATPLRVCPPDSDESVVTEPVKFSKTNVNNSSSSDGTVHTSCVAASCTTGSDCMQSIDTICACSKPAQGDSTSQDSGLCTCSQSSLSLANSVPPVGGSSPNEAPDMEDEEGKFSPSIPQREDSFDDFQHAGECGTVCQETLLPVLHEDSDDDGFADFECAEAGSEFADFSAAFQEVPEGEDKGEWATFAANEESVETSPVVVDTHLEDCSTETLVCRAFPASVPIREANLSTDTDVKSLEEHEAHKRLWEDLQDLDHAPSLRHQWGTSLSCQYLLRSLNIDSRNILRNPSVPLFAMHLGMLEPQRGDSAAGGTCIDCPPSPPSHQESIPPAQFDWRSSGLENPLEQPSSSSLLDLEFLSSLSPSASTPLRTSSLEEEFLSDSPVTVNGPKLPPQLQQLLESKASNMSTMGRPTELSTEARRLLDQLPDLSFMRATVLMFPVHL